MHLSTATPLRRRLSSRSIFLLASVALAALAFAGAGSAAAPGAADLRITKSADSATVSVGATLTYTIQVENLGPDAASGVTVTDQLPKGADYVSATSTLGACALQGQKVTCAVGALEAGAAAKVSTATVTLKVIPRQPGTISNTASVKGDQQDPVAANDKATVTTRVLGPAASASCRGLRATVVGTAGSDDLVGTGGRDVIAALGGNDTIVALAGRDLICAGGGRDDVVAGSAADRVFGGAGKDLLAGRGGPDVLKGNGGNDVLTGNRGDDRLRGAPASTRAAAGRGWTRPAAASASEACRAARARAARPSPYRYGVINATGRASPAERRSVAMRRPG